MDIINIGSRREVLWDDYLVQEATAVLVQHKPQYKGKLFSTDMPWEGSYVSSLCIVNEEDYYRMYYSGLITSDYTFTDYKNYLCYAESKDGVNWVRPDLGFCDFEGSATNNILMDEKTSGIYLAGFYVFKDTNPNCPPDELYKALEEDIPPGELILLYLKSADGIHWEKVGPITTEGYFDSLNVAFWDKNTEQYFCYFRGYHDSNGILTRDIRVMTSKDFKNWTSPIQIEYIPGVPEFQIYNNNIMQYYRADHMFIGIPTRYFERGEWSPSFDSLPNPDNRKERSKIDLRYGTALTDCLLMTSRDGYKFNRRNETFISPGPERKYNWCYGDCYSVYGIIETKSDRSDAPNELSILVPTHYWSVPRDMERYTIRIDGFCSYDAPYEGGYLLTKPFIYSGCDLSLNFATSIVGEIKIALTDENGNKYHTAPIFGDSLDRKVVFDGLDLGSLAGKPVTLRFDMIDAQIFSFKFE